jgi:hypothetical protein
MRKRYEKKIASTLLVIWILNICTPLTSWALTSGPSQPEMASFQPAGVTEMVDLSSGDFKYNIPLLEVDGYPINLSYQSGASMEDEASWVGLGWNLNIGSITRQLRGLPDDASGDEVKITHDVKSKVTIGGRITGKAEIRGENNSNKAKPKASLSIGLFYDNYTGMGAELGANAGISLSMMNDGRMTAGLGIGLMSSTVSGVSANVSPYMNMSISEKSKSDILSSAGLSTSLGYNSRSGMKDLSLGLSFSNNFLMRQNEERKAYSDFMQGLSSSISYNTEPIYPSIQVPFKTNYTSVSLDIGAVGGVWFYGGGFTGYKSVKEVASRSFSNQAFGFLYADKAENNPLAIMDFVREKDNPVTPTLPNMAIPVPLPDLFSYHNQLGGGQFRLYRATGIFGDNEVTDRAHTTSIGADLGFGVPPFGGVHAGVSLFNQNGTTTSRLWRDQNSYYDRGKFRGREVSNPARDHVYFKMVGEKSWEDEALAGQNMLSGKDLLSIGVNGITAQAPFKGRMATDEIKKNKMEPKRNAISYLTAKEARTAALDKKLWSYPSGVFTNLSKEPTFMGPGKIEGIERNAGYRKNDHISEISVTAADGGRQVYGIPVYNTTQVEYSFALGSIGYTANDNQVSYVKNGASINHKKGFDYYYHEEQQPAYATSYLLTSILSPDYEDNDDVEGISDNDQGHAIKFNYTKMVSSYKWRSPYATDKAILNKGLLADPYDDKGSIVYGEKELWYTHSIESKTHIAYFILEDRKDGLGVENMHGGKGTVKQKRLMEIKLYAKADRSKPIKVVKFDYDYSLCPNVPNQEENGKGKLTLKKVWFEYGNITKGKYNFYEFDYGNNNPSYSSSSSDRWGSYKGHPIGALTNEYYPYSLQDPTADEKAGAWNLKAITLPTGGKISVDYESDDYAFVQDKRAMVMTPLTGMVNDVGNDETDLIEARGMKIALNDLPSDRTGDITKWFKDTYLNGSDYIYAKLLVKMKTRFASSETGKEHDYIAVHSKIDIVNRNPGEPFVKIKLEEREGVNPIVVAAWQKIKNEYPRYAYRGFSDMPDANVDVTKAVKAVISSFKNLSELGVKFNTRAQWSENRFASEYDVSSSFVRLVKTDGMKKGGGGRVKEIRIEDKWGDMAGNSNQNKVYGQRYEYTTERDGKIISSGVAANEPTLGADENPLRQPVPYIEQINGASSNFFAVEEPFGESYYPAPSVVYSKVTVKDLAPGSLFGSTPATGSTVHEFYTARDFPVRVKYSIIDPYRDTPDLLFNLVSASSIDKMSLSQGYNIELNDMHGKPKAIRTFNSKGAEIASTVYHYHSNKSGLDGLELNNKVPVIMPDGKVRENQTIGVETDFFVDMREQESINSGTMIATGVDIVTGFIIPIPIPHFPEYQNDDYKLFRSACAVKVIQSYGILKEVIKTENGSSVSSENIAYDALSGEVLVSRTKNEHNQDIYSVNLPAYWVYKGMGGAYQSSGITIKDLSTGVNGELDPKFSSLFVSGDEILTIGKNENKKYWIVETDGVKRLIDEKGKTRVEEEPIEFAKVVRSGYRNMLDVNTSSLICMVNPIVNAGAYSKLVLSDVGNLKDYEVLQATVTTFDEKWAPKFIEKKYEQEVKEVIKTSIWAHITERDPKEYGYGGGFGSYKRQTHTLLDVKFYKSNSWSKPTMIPQNMVNWTGQLRFKTYHTGTEFFRDVNNASQVSLQSDEIKIIDGQPYSYIWYSRSAALNGWEDHRPYLYDVYLENFVSKQSASIFNNSYKYSAFNDNYGIVQYGIEPVYQTVEAPFNPYHFGYLGNWKPSETKIYQANRTNTIQGNATELKKSGHFTELYSYWNNGGNIDNGWTVIDNSYKNKWVTANTITQYSPQGQELENKDALGIYSAAKFAFGGQLAVAIASNARHREIYANTFEDVFSNLENAIDFKHYGSSTPASLIPFIVINNAHTGHKSLKLPNEGIVLSTSVHDKENKAAPYFDIHATRKTYVIKPFENNAMPSGFQPKYGSNKYVFSAWVKDGHPLDRGVFFKLHKNTSEVTLNCRAIVEGWKLVEGMIDLSDLTNNAALQIKITPNSGEIIYVDDLRIHPKDSHMKTYTYSPFNFKLMAELDANNLSTFYEYDDEGILSRVKKETERGIVMVKESRQANVRRQQN